MASSSGAVSALNLGAPVGSASGVEGNSDAAARSPGSVPSAHFLRWVLQQQPSLQGSVLEILQRQDRTQKQKYDQIAMLFRQANERSAAQARSAMLANSSERQLSEAAARAAAMSAQNEARGSLNTSQTQKGKEPKKNSMPSQPPS